MGEHIGVVVIHGVGDTEPGWTNDYLIPHLTRRDPNLILEDHCEVHRLEDKGRTRRGVRFPAYFRRGTLHGQGEPSRVTFAELCWSDLSRVGQSSIAGFFVMIQLFYEAPLVLGASFLRQKQTGLRWVLASIIRFANWLLRWPITGLNAAAFLTALGMLIAQKLHEIDPLSDWLYGWTGVTFERFYVYGVCLMLMAISFFTLRFARRHVHKGLLLTDLALSTSIFSSILLVLAGGAALIGKFPAGSERLGLEGALSGPSPFLTFASWPIMGLWWLWNHVVVAGILLLLVMAVGKMFTSSGQPFATLMRPASALGLTTIQGMIWKVVITLLWVLMIGGLDPSIMAFCEEPAKCTGLQKLSSDLFAIFGLNLLLATVLGIAVLGLVLLRSALVRFRKKVLLAGHARLPRLIVSPWLVALMFALTVFNFAAYMPQVYNPLLAKEWVRQYVDIQLPDPLQIYASANKLFASGIMAYFMGTAASLLVYLMFMRALQNSSRGVLHIVRDLVDHQYTPEFTMTRFMLPRAKSQSRKYPRRERIQKRLDELMAQMEEEKCQHLVLLAHSQGTVILHDYLRSKQDEKTLKWTRRIDVVTLGSPLGHFYQHYFPVYESASSSAPLLSLKLESWTNLYRIDDPIGSKVSIVSGGFIHNVPLEAGGHMDYWREPRVCEVILGLIDPARAGEGRGPGARPA